MKKLEPIIPGEILSEEFLKPIGLSQYRLAKEIDVPAQRISEIVNGKRSITADTDLRLCRFFGLSSGYWLRAQAAHDTEVAERTLYPKLFFLFFCFKFRYWITHNFSYTSFSEKDSEERATPRKLQLFHLHRCIYPGTQVYRNLR